MAEGGSFLENVAKRFGFGEKPSKSPEADKLTPEQRAQQAFYELSATSTAKNGLEGGAIFEPDDHPDSKFIPGNYGDCMTFRINNRLNALDYDFHSYKPVYVCVVKGKEGADDLMFVPMFPKTDGNKFSINPDFDDVVSFPLPKNAQLDWGTPSGLFPDQMFVYETYVVNGQRSLRPGEFNLTIESIELLSGGNTQKQKSPETAPAPSRSPVAGLAPQKT